MTCLESPRLYCVVNFHYFIDCSCKPHALTSCSNHFSFIFMNCETRIFQDAQTTAAVLEELLAQWMIVKRTVTSMVEAVGP